MGKQIYTDTFVDRTLGIIGYGRFGKLLHEILLKTISPEKIKIYSRSQQENKEFVSLAEVAACDIVIPAVPIHAFEKVINNVTSFLKPHATIIDVCSVKLYPKEIMMKHLPATVNIIATHPMFGPGSYEKVNGDLSKLSILVENIRCDERIYQSFISYLQEAGFKIVEMDADTHDKLAAEFHFTAQFTATMLKDLGMQRSTIETKSAEALFEFLEMIQSDSKELLKDMYQYNPYCPEQLDKIKQSYKQTITFLNEN